VVLITDIYSAGEEAIEGVTAASLAEEIERFGHRRVTYIGGIEQAAVEIAAVVEPGDLVITLGAGNVWRAGEEYLRSAG
jgi:UDP-N-acetylmuramate--alanine ligase